MVAELSFQPPLLSLHLQFCLSSDFSAFCACFSKSLGSLFPSACGYTVQYMSPSFCCIVMAVLVSVAITLCQNDYSSPDSLYTLDKSLRLRGLVQNVIKNSIKIYFIYLRTRRKQFTTANTRTADAEMHTPELRRVCFRSLKASLVPVTHQEFSAQAGGS